MRQYSVLIVGVAILVACTRADADQNSSGGAIGNYGRTTSQTGTQGATTTRTAVTSKRAKAVLPTHTSILGGIYGDSIVLPPTSLDSFVYSAGSNAELIYGDEGTDDIPPYFEFDKSHRIQTGITGVTAVGLTTEHGSYLPDAWGGDEFVQGPEFDMSAPSLPITFTVNNAANFGSNSGF